MSKYTIRSRLGSGRWERVLPRTYRLVGVPGSFEQQVVAATLWSGGVASHETAAAAWGLDGGTLRSQSTLAQPPAPSIGSRCIARTGLWSVIGLCDTASPSQPFREHSLSWGRRLLDGVCRLLLITTARWAHHDESAERRARAPWGARQARRRAFASTSRGSRSRVAATSKCSRAPNRGPHPRPRSPSRPPVNRVR
jgi:hypothetical protein